MRVLMSRHSEGWEHSFLPHAEVVVKKLGIESGLYEAVTTARSTLITAEELAKYDVLVMATTGELPWAEEQKQAVLDFVRGGKGLFGIHNATDTFYKWAEYGEMLGGYFDGHPWTQEVAVKVEDTEHPATCMLGESFRLFEEIYTIKNFDRSKTHLLMSLDTDSVDLAQDKKGHDEYPMGWCHEYGEGRVIYSALGHPDELWDEQWFQEHILACIKWAGRLV